MNSIKKNAMPILGGIILLAGIYMYSMYFGGSSAPAITSSSDTDATTQKLLVMLQSLHTIKLDASIFDDTAFKSLSDFGVTLPQGTYGRRNPFLPLGGTGTGAQQTGGVQIQLPKAK